MTRFTPQWLQAGSYSASMDRRLVGALWPTGASSGAAVSPASAMILNVAAGQVAVPTQNNTGATLCTWDAVEQVTLAAAPGSGSNRYDVVIVQPRGNDLDGGANTDFILTSVTGTAVASPTVPAIPAGTIALAQVYIPGGSASVTAGNITDLRPWGLAVAGASALPPPVAGNLQSFTDATGEVWVAKGGVYGGAWKRARDVLHSRGFRAAAYTITATSATLAFDTIMDDPYTLLNVGTGGFAAPVAGLYNFSGNVTVAGIASQWVSVNAARNGAMAGWTGGLSNPIATFACHIPWLLGPVRLAAGDVLTLQTSAGASTTGQPNQNQTWAQFDYVGTG